MAQTGDYCPMANAAEVFATRWTPVVLRNLLAGCNTFTSIREHAPGLSRQVLTERLRMLEHHQLITRTPQPDGTVLYALTPAGEGARGVCDALGMWGEQYLELTPVDVDPGNLLRWLVKALLPDDLPEARTVVRFEVHGTTRSLRYWVLLDTPEAEVCRKPPGPEDDLVVTTSPEWLAKWHTGRTSVGESMKAGAVAFDGPLDLARRVAAWGGRGVYDRPMLAMLAELQAARSAATAPAR
jgi:DNA-binding HxlR family transcriptional regulator